MASSTSQQRIWVLGANPQMSSARPNAISGYVCFDHFPSYLISRGIFRRTHYSPFELNADDDSEPSKGFATLKIVRRLPVVPRRRTSR